MGMGAFIRSGDMTIELSDKEPARKGNTNNVAEYRAVILLLRYLVGTRKTGKFITIYGDSKLVVNQLNGIWRILDGEYVPFANEAKQLFADLKANNTVNIKWIPRHKNRKADELSKKR
jgi:ribonuclease HI